jgi:iron complex transport system substrate-binding protein
MRSYCCIALISFFMASAWAVEPLTVTDYVGRSISLAQPVKRIIALSPHIVENVFSAGAGDLLVGVESYADYPEAVHNIQKVGGIQGFSLEAIISLQPDLVIVWPSFISPMVLQKILDLGFTVYLDEPRQLTDIAKSIHDIGVLTGREAMSQKAVNNYLAQLADLQQQYAHRKSVSLFYEIWNQPLQTINGQHIISDVMRLCGGRNIFAEAETIAPKVSLESVLARNPDVIIASGMGDIRPDWLDDWTQWPSLHAVKNKHLFFVPSDLLERHTLRLLQGAQLLCEQLEQARK